MKTLSGNRIALRQTCHGPTLLVESDLGKTRARALFGLLPEGDSVRIFCAFGTPRRGLWRLRLRLARWLYLSFLSKDFKVVEGMRLVVDGVEDVGVRALSGYLQSLPDLLAERPLAP